MIIRNSKLKIVGLFLSVLLLAGQIGMRVYADSSICSADMSDLDCSAVINGWEDWVPDTGADACGISNASSVSLSGNDPETKIYNYLLGKNGLTPIAVAGIMGNMQAESHFDSSIEQKQGSWEDMSNARFEGVGLVQWDGGRRPNMIKYAASKGVSLATLKTAGNDTGLSTELDYVLQELTTSYKTTLAALLISADPGDAAYNFHQLYEGSSDGPNKIQGRMNNAIAIFNKYSGSTVSTDSSGTATVATGTAGTTNGCSSSTPDCAAAAGVAKILCAAKVYDPISYSESAAGGHLSGGAAAWHKTCPVIGPSCVLDCSGLVNIAVYDAFGADINENTKSEISDSNRAGGGKYWQKVSITQVQPGDIMQPNVNHVEIVDHIQGNTIITFAAHTDSYPQPRQVSPASYPIQAGQVYLHYIGPGSSANT